jgi:hypothetical protein
LSDGEILSGNRKRRRSQRACVCLNGDGGGTRAEPLTVLAVTQEGLPLTLHVHPAVVVTATEMFPPAAATSLKLDGLIV